LPLHRKLGLLAGLVAVIPAGVSSASASSQTAKVQLQPIDARR